ncbi:hypothetical protein [Rhodanobacter sp. Soil772]|nr:hypothetical protein [Rhodanobacter sp. Soil772]
MTARLDRHRRLMQAFRLPAQSGFAADRRFVVGGGMIMKMHHA